MLCLMAVWCHRQCPLATDPPTAPRQSTEAQSVGSGAGLLGTGSLSPTTCRVTSGGSGKCRVSGCRATARGPLLSAVRMLGAGKAGRCVGGLARPPGCCQKWAGIREPAHSVFTSLMGHKDPPWRLCVAGRMANDRLLSLPRTHSPPPPAFGAQLTSGLDGFRVPGVKGQGHLALGHRLFSCEGLSQAV